MVSREGVEDEAKVLPLDGVAATFAARHHQGSFRTT